MSINIKWAIKTYRRHFFKELLAFYKKTGPDEVAQCTKSKQPQAQALFGMHILKVS